MRRRAGGSALVAGRLGVTLGARADGYASGPALTAGHLCDTPGAHCGKRSRSQALCQRQLGCCRRKQEETLRSASGTTRSLAGTELPCRKNNSPGSWCTQGPGFGRQVQSGRQAQTEDGGSEEAISDKSSGGRGIITGKELGEKVERMCTEPYAWGT